MFTNDEFGIEIEGTYITRADAAKVAAEFLNGTIEQVGDYYDSYKVTAEDGRVWKFMYDGSIKCLKKINGRTVSVGREYSCEMVSPILTYSSDIETLQELVRRLKKAGFAANKGCGIHIHTSKKGEHTPRTLRNLVNLVASKGDLLYKALQIEPERERYCKRMDEYMVRELNEKKPRTIDGIKKIWYAGTYESQSSHYNSTRYALCNLHSYFNGHGTCEFRAYNSNRLHCGEIRSYIALSLALNRYALNSKSVSPRKNQAENEKFAMRTFLNRIGFIGEEFKNCREHLTKNLSGDSAFRFGRP